MIPNRSGRTIDFETFDAGYEGIEAANKLQVIYIFEEEIHYTESFQETIKWINEDDGHWADFNEIWDGTVGKYQDPEDPTIDPLSFMVISLLELHLARLRLDYSDEDFEVAKNFLYAFYEFQWMNLLEKLTRSREMWLPLFMLRDEVNDAQDSVGI